MLRTTGISEALNSALKAWIASKGTIAELILITLQQQAAQEDEEVRRRQVLTVARGRAPHFVPRKLLDLPLERFSFEQMESSKYDATVVGMGAHELSVIVRRSGSTESRTLLGSLEIGRSGTCWVLQCPCTGGSGVPCRHMLSAFSKLPCFHGAGEGGCGHRHDVKTIVWGHVHPHWHECADYEALFKVTLRGQSAAVAEQLKNSIDGDDFLHFAIQTAPHQQRSNTSRADSVPFESDSGSGFDTGTASPMQMVGSMPATGTTGSTVGVGDLLGDNISVEKKKLEGNFSAQKAYNLLQGEVARLLSVVIVHFCLFVLCVYVYVCLHVCVYVYVCVNVNVCAYFLAWVCGYLFLRVFFLFITRLIIIKL